MQKLNGSKWSFVTVIGAVLILALCGTTGAVAGSLVTSAKIKNNTIKSKDVRNNALTSVDVKTSSLNGTDIADGSLTNQDVGVLYASVESDGDLDASSGNVVVTDEGAPGQWGVRFVGRDIRKCAFSATVADLGGGSTTGQVSVADLAGRADGVYVWTQDSAGATSTRDFHLVVVC